MKRTALLCLFLAACAAQPTTAWRVDDLAGVTASEINLRRKADGSTAATISTAHAKSLLAMRNAMATMTGHSAELQIVDSKEPNAFSGYADGKAVVGFSVGMIQLFPDDDAACAAIMGHEFAHLALGHAAAGAKREQARSAASSLAGIVLGLAGVPMGGTVADLATQAVSTVYSRDDEREADRVGVDLMKRAGYDPKGAVRAWEKMAAVSGSGIPFLSTHPTSAERLETMKRLAAQ
jgi:predicted Zn-dependent protease